MKYIAWRMAIVSDSFFIKPQENVLKHSTEKFLKGCFFFGPHTIHLAHSFQEGSSQYAVKTEWRDNSNFKFFLQKGRFPGLH